MHLKKIERYYFKKYLLHNAQEFKLRLIHNHIKLFFENHSLKSTTIICSTYTYQRYFLAEKSNTLEYT